jgi:hypothetical protein
LSRKRSVNHADGMFARLPSEAAPLCRASCGRHRRPPRGALKGNMEF